MPTRLNRRQFLSAGAAGGLLLTAGGRAAGAGATAPSLDTRGRARNIIFLVSDGMSTGTLAMAELHRWRTEGRHTHWVSVFSRPDACRALMDTASADSHVTDSAAAASAWGCGTRVNNGAINTAPDGRPLIPIYQLARAAGKRTGLVSTATITHATPAGFVAQVDARAEEDAIATQYLQAGVDVLLGGGSKFFTPQGRKDRKDLVAAFAQAGYRHVADADGLRSAPADGRLLGLFADSHLPYTLDHRNDAILARRVPTLAEMTKAALARLAPAADTSGFILQVEGARVDHGAHANDLGAVLFDQLAFDDAVGEVLAFAGDRDDTLVILTSDHGNANPGINGTGTGYRESNRNFEKVVSLRRTNSWIIEGMNKDSSTRAIRDRVAEGTGLGLTQDETEILRRALRKEHRESYRVREAALVTLGQLLSNHISVGWSGVAHTSDYTELTAFGAGAEAIRGCIKNADLFAVMTRATGLTT